MPDVCQCFGDIVAPFGVIGIDDLLSVINHWGNAPAGSANAVADIQPYPFGDGVVNIDDLLAVINQWGECPP